MRIIKRDCVVCGKKLTIKVEDSGKYSGGYYFGEVDAPIEGTGEWKQIKEKFERMGIVEWTGKNKKVECWECEKCFNED